MPSNVAEWRPRNEKNAAFEYPLANRPLRRSRYGRCARKPMGKKSAAATHRHTLSLAPNSITLLRAQRLSHQGVASQHEKPNEGAGFFFLSLSRSICSSIVGSYVNVSTTQHPEMRAKRSAVPIARIIILPFSFRYSGRLPDADAHHLEAPSCAFCESLFGTSRPLIASEETR